jgi:hypothetical protein
MGWKSTRDITRQECLAAIVERLNKASNESLADALESLTDADRDDEWHCYNFWIVPEGTGEQ